MPLDEPAGTGDKDGLEARLVGQHFAVAGPDLLVGGVPVREIAAAAGTPAFIYDGGVMRRAYRSLARALDGFAGIHYSVKANPAPAVIRLFLEEGAGVEIASIGEYRLALAAGALPERMLFAGPAKRVDELEEVIADGIGEIHLESYEEIERVAAIGRRSGRAVQAAIRVNPVPAAQAGAMRMGGKPTAFGFDEEDMDRVIDSATAAGHIELTGVHLFAGTQILDADGLVSQWRHGIAVAAGMAARIGRRLRTIDLGGGLGIPYFPGEHELDLARVAAAIPALRDLVKSNPLLAQARVVVEPGRYLAGPAGVYVVETNAVKHSRGQRFVVTDGGMHHHLAASGNLGQIIKRDYPVVAPAKMDTVHKSPATVAGPLCTPLDTLARAALLPELAAGDLVAVLQSGAYGATASPGRFLSHPAPAEVLAEDGKVQIIAAA
jgi:diaminopimelate decarboxylase